MLDRYEQGPVVGREERSAELGPSGRAQEVPIVAPIGDELVEVVEALVVAGVGDDAAVSIDDRVRALVLVKSFSGSPGNMRSVLLYS
jgi:hypothetical protein